MHVILIPLLDPPPRRRCLDDVGDRAERWQGDGVVRPFSYICNSTYDYCNSTRSNSTFQANLAIISYELAGNAKASGFALRAFGDTPYTAYGLRHCREDFLGDQCVRASCWGSASRCPPSTSDPEMRRCTKISACSGSLATTTPQTWWLHETRTA